MLAQRTFSQVERGRYYVALSLEEAEHLRGVLHECKARGRSLVPNSTASLALRLPSDRTLLDCSTNYAPAKSFQEQSADQLFRFLNSDTYYTPRQFNLLLMALQDNTREHRQSYFELVRSCRRRKQRPVQMTPLNRVFTTPDEYHLLEHRATLSRIRKAIHTRGMFLHDFFQKADHNKDNRLSSSEIYSGLRWLGIEISPGEIHELVRYIDQNADGQVSYKEIRGAMLRSGMGAEDEAKELLAAAGVAGGNVEDLAEEIEIHKIEELYEDRDAAAKKPDVEPLPHDYLKNIEIKL